jgi:hypothetical protein
MTFADHLGQGLRQRSEARFQAGKIERGKLGR